MFFLSAKLTGGSIPQYRREEAKTHRPDVVQGIDPTTAFGGPPPLMKGRQEAVLVAIAIPVFTTQLEKAREGTDLSNIRSAYAEAALVVVNGTTDNLGNSSVTGGAISASKTGDVWTVTIANFPINQQTAGWVIDTSNIASYNKLNDATDGWKPTKGTYAIKFTIDGTGKLTGIGV